MKGKIQRNGKGWYACLNCYDPGVVYDEYIYLHVKRAQLRSRGYFRDHVNLFGQISTDEALYCKSYRELVSILSRICNIYITKSHNPNFIFIKTNSKII